jgi:hypothetical protein
MKVVKTKDEKGKSKQNPRDKNGDLHWLSAPQKELVKLSVQA